MLNKITLYIFTVLVAFSDARGQEKDVTEIILEGSAKDKTLEMSGLTWYKDKLILLPQYIDYDDPAFYSISKSRINKWLNEESKKPIIPQKIKLKLPDYRKSIKGYQGFEAICFDGRNVYLVIESKDSDVMKSYIVMGVINRDNSLIEINNDSLTEIPVPVNIKNMGFESLIKHRNQILAIFEANGKNIYPDPKIVSFDRSLKNSKLLTFENLEYRLTDATRVDNKSRFWALNFYWPGEKKRLNPAFDEVLEKTDEGDTHKMYDHVERLVEYKIYKNKVERTQTDPIQFVINKESRNWEGVVRFDKKGFIVVVDEYPRTILAFVENKLK